MPTYFNKCLTVLYLHYNEAMQLLFLFFFYCVRISPEEQHVAELVCRSWLCSFGFWKQKKKKKKVHLDYGLFWLFFSPECSNPADMVQCVKITNQKIFRLK